MKSRVNLHNSCNEGVDASDDLLLSIFSLVTVCILLDPAETLVSSVSLLSGRQRWKSAEYVALSISVSLSPFYSACLSQCFWNDTEKISMSLCKC